MEKINKIKIKTKASTYLTYKFSLLCKTVLINFPLEVSNPVLKATAKQPLLGGLFYYKKIFF